MSDSDEEPPPLEDMSQYLPKAPQPTAPVVERTVKAAPVAEAGTMSGLKKGFLTAKPAAKKPAAAARPPPPAAAEVIDVRPTQPKSSGLVLSEVQQAMQYTTDQQQEWLTPDLLQRFAQNPVLARGFTNPRCMAAVEEMRTDPKAASAKYGNDAEVREFLKEFAGLMAGHFGEIGQRKQEEATQKAQTDPEVERLLHDKGVKRVITRMQQGLPVDLHE